MYADFTIEDAEELYDLGLNVVCSGDSLQFKTTPNREQQTDYV